jgi:hypothetical protein
MHSAPLRARLPRTDVDISLASNPDAGPCPMRRVYQLQRIAVLLLEPKKMLAFAGKLTDTEMARAPTFVRKTWGHDAAPLTMRDGRLMRDSPGQ